MKKYVLTILLLVCLATSARSQQFSWHLGSGPFDGPVYSILVHPNGTIYVGGYRLFWTSDHYATWSELPHKPNSLNPAFSALALDSIHRVLVGTGIGLSYLDTVSDSLITLLPGVGISALSVSSSGAIYGMTSNNTLLRSGDNGRIWTDVSPPQSFGQFVSLLCDHVGNVFVGTREGILRSEDSGRSWQELVNGLTQGSFLSLACSLSGDIYASNSEVFHSRDEGRTWTLIDSSRRGAAMLICSRPDGELIQVDVGSPAISCRITTNAGITWVAVEDSIFEPGEPDFVAESITWDPRGEWLVGILGDGGGGTPGGVLTCADHNLLLTKRGVPSAVIQTVIADKSGTIFCGYSGDQFKKSRDDGKTWTVIPVEGGNPLLPRNLAIDSTEVLLFADRSGRLFSIDSADSSKLLFSHLPAGDTADIAVGPGNVYYLSSSSFGIYRSSDRGSTWDQYSAGIVGAGLTCIAATPWNTIYCGGDRGLNRSLDEGVTWTPVALGAGGSTVSTILVTQQREIFVGTDSCLIRSSDSGDTWYKVSGNFHSVIRAVTSTQAGDVMAGTDSGIFYLKKGYSQWSSLDSGLHNFGISTLWYDAKSQRFIAGTNGSSFYYGYGIIGDLTQSVKRSTASEPGLQIYPNPSNGKSQIEITLASTTIAKLRLLDVLGKEVKVIFDGNEQAGLSTFSLDATDLPTGVYIVRLEANRQFYTRPILVRR